MQGSQHTTSRASLKSESVWFKTKLVSQFLSLSFLLTQPFYLSYLHAAPVGGNVVGGSGSISQSDLTTTINQNTQNLAIDWQSFDINVDEQVNFVQPNTSSIALNRIIGNNGSVIQGQINANGQVFLVNPNGILFTSSATVNVGGLVASGLDMTPSDFMNGNYIFNEVMGANGNVINSGVINAATGGKSTGGKSIGGNVALIGKQVKNEGLISAHLGSTALVAGKKVILRFDNQGLIGVRVTKEVLQDEIGVDEAVINSGEIKAAGGRVLLTASTSRDVFSQVVNNADIRQATSAVVNADGSFTLGRGADVLNSGSIDVSSTSNLNNTKVILLGENITNSGSIRADVENGTAGEIEIHANNKTLLTQNSITSSQALVSGNGGLIKVLGDKVGLFDQAQVNASGANGGGEVLIGGDRQGLNTSIRNADFIYLGEKTIVKADAIDSGNGGKIITFAKDSAQIHGNLFARGGSTSGNGGFIETSGLHGFSITNAPDVSAVNGNGGLWLIDPYSITIVNDADCGVSFTCTLTSPFTSNATESVIKISLIQNALVNGNVDVTTGDGGVATEGDITFQANLDFSISGNAKTNSLTLNANRDIIFKNASSISSVTNDGLDLILNTGRNVSLSSAAVGLNTNGGDVIVSNSSSIDFAGATITTGGGKFEIQDNTNDVTSSAASSITTSSGDFIVKKATNFDSSNVNINVASGSINLDGVNGDVVLGSLTANASFGSDLSITKATSISQATGSTIVIARNTDLGATSVTETITLEEGSNDFFNIKLQATDASILDRNDVNIIGGTNVSNLLKISATGDIKDSGSFSAATAIFDTTITDTSFGNILLDNNNDFNNVKISNANDVTIIDVTGGIAIEANNSSNSGGIRGFLTINSTGTGDITDLSGVTIPNSGGQQFTGEINVGGASRFSVAANQSIYLGNSANTFGGAVNFASDGTIQDITITDDTALTLPTLNIAGDLNVTADSIIFNDTTVGGTLDATTTSGDITRTSGNLDINGLTTFNATGNITLTDSNNDFSDVTITNGNTVSLRDTDTLRLLSSSTSGDLLVQADQISLVGNISTNKNTAVKAGNVNFNGDVVLAPATDGGTITINTNATGMLTDGIVTFQNDLDNDQITTTPRNNLTIISGDGDVDFQGNVGGTRNIGSLIINSGINNSTAIVNLNTVRTQANALDPSTNAIDITAGTINLNGDLETNNVTSFARGVNLEGKIVLATDILIDTSNSNSDGAVTIVGTVNSDTTNRSLTITSESGAVDLQQAIGGTAALSALTINSGTQLGTVNLNAVTTNGGNNVVRVDGSIITLNGNINSNKNGAGGDIRFDGDLVLNNSVTIDSAGTGSNGQVDVNGDINGVDALNSNRLTITAGDNTVNLNNVGNNQAIQQLSIINTSGAINVGAISTRDNTAPATNDTGVVLTSAGTINLRDDITTNVIGGNGNEVGSVDINGVVELGGDVIISTNGVSSAGSVDFSSTVNADSAGNDRVLTVNAGTATVKFNGVIGGNQAINSLVVNSAGTTSLQAVNTRRGGLDVTSGTINLAGNLDTKDETAAGQIRLVGAVNLNANTTFDTDGTVSDANIFINGSVNNTSSQSLELNAGSADVTLTGTAGGTTALTDLTVIGNTVSLGNVTTVNAIDVTGNTNGDGVINLSGNLTTTGVGSSSSIDLKQANIILNSDVTLQVANGTANSITLDGTVNADADTNNRTLSIVAGSGLVDLKSDIGAAVNGAVQSLIITGTGITNLQKVTTRSGGLTVSTGTLNLADNITTTDGNVKFTASGQINTGATVLTMDTGLGDITVNKTINAANGFNVTSSGKTSLNGVTVSTTDAILNVNASNGLTLTGAYKTDNTAMGFNADSDADGLGLLTLSDGASFTFTNDQEISFTGAGYTAGTGVIIDAGANRVQFNATADLALGSAGAFSLSNAQLAAITASSLEFNAATNINFSDLTQSSGPAYVLNAGNDIFNSGLQTSLFSTLDATATNNFNVGANITSTNNLSLTGTNINITNSALLTSVNGDVILNGAITGASGQLAIMANNGTAQFVLGSNVTDLGSLNIIASSIDLGVNTNVTTFNDITLSLSSTGATFNQNANLSSTLGDIKITAGANDLVMGSSTTTTARGNITLTTTDGDIGLANTQSTQGIITVTAGNGRIYDNNGSATNITSSNAVTLTATNGIGSGDPLELVMNGTNAWLSASNLGSGNIEFENVGELRLENVTNAAAGGTFALKNTGGNVTINSLKIDKNSDLSIAMLDVTGGNVLGVQGDSAPHVTANTAIFQMNNSGSVGVLGEPLITDVPNKIEVISATGTFIQFFGQVPPKDFIGDNAYRNRALQSIESLSGQQLIQVESLAETDPAIFTDVRNYAHSDIAIMMPSGQRYTTDEEEQEKKQKRKELLNSAP